MKKNEVLNLVTLFEEKHHGELLHWSEESRKIYDEVKKHKIFKCEVCGKMCHYWELENWLCDFEKNEYECSLCYEDEMGEDL